MEQKLCIGKIVKTIGIKGEVKVIGYTDNLSRFKSLTSFFIDENEYMCQSASIRNGFVALKILGVDCPEQAEKFKDKLIYVDRKNAVKLDTDRYFIADLIDCEIVDDSGNFLGKITDVENFGASDILVFEKDNKEFRVPFLMELFEKIDVEQNVLVATEKFYEVMVWELIF